MSHEDRERWNRKYAEKSLPEQLVPDEWLKKCVANRSPGHALDFACGLGHNAIWLAKQGWKVDAVDISTVGLKLAKKWADELDVHGINWIATDLENCSLEKDRYDLVVVFRFLDRGHLPKLISSVLKPGGFLVYETFHRNHLNRPDTHLKNPEFTLSHEELRKMYAGLEIVEYHDPLELEDRCVSRLFAKRTV